MVGMEVHRQALTRRYYASLFSGTTLFCALESFLLLFLPLIIAFSSGAFWLTEVTLLSQPQVEYTYTTIVQIEGMNAPSNGSSGSSPFTVIATPSSLLQSILGSPSFSSSSLSSGGVKVRQAVVRSAQFDDLRDGVIDRIELSLLIPLLPSERVTSITALAFLNAKLVSEALGGVSYAFDALASTSYASSSSLKGLSLDGSFLLQQSSSSSLRSKGGTHTPYASSPLLPASYVKGLPFGEVSLKKILSSYAARNLSMVFTPRLVLPFPSPLRPFLSPSSAENAFNLSMIIRVPVQPMRYDPPVSQILKQAWIQYLAFFLVTAFLLSRLNTFLYSNQLLKSFAVSDGGDSGSGEGGGNGAAAARGYYGGSSLYSKKQS